MWGWNWMSSKRRGLRFWVLNILRRKPKNGAEIMDDIESTSQGWWRPSPGSIYPLLEELTTEGLISKREDGRYELTQTASDDLGWAMPGTRPPRTVSDVLEEMRGYIAYLEDLSRSDTSVVSAEKPRIQSLASRLESLAK